MKKDRPGVPISEVPPRLGCQVDSEAMRVRGSCERIVHFLSETWVGRLVATAVLGLVLYYHFFDVFGDGEFRYHIDLDVYRSGGQAFVRGFGLYDRDYPVRGINLPFTYPPLAAILFSTLTWFSLKTDTLLMVFATAAMTWWCGAVLINHFTDPVRTSGAGGKSAQQTTTSSFKRAGWLSYMVLPLVLLGEPFTHTLSFGQINVFLMALVLLDTAVKRTRWPRGIFIGLAAAIKLTPAVFGLFFLVKRDWKSAITCAVSGVAWTAIGWAVLPHDSKDYWTVEIHNPDRIGGLAYAGNQSLRGMIARFTNDDTLQSRWWVVLSVLTFGLILTAMLRLMRTASRLQSDPGAGNRLSATGPRYDGQSFTIALVAATSLVALLLSPVSWSHHWVWFLPFVIVTMNAAWNSRHIIPRWQNNVLWVVAVVGLMISTVTPFHWFFPNSENQELQWSLIQKMVGSDYALWGFLFLITMALFPRAFTTEKS